jgi:glycosyltransferase involved in cell wall biosynthesis
MSVRYLFLAAEGFPSTVYSSQVADLLRVLDRAAGIRFDVLNFDPLYPRTLLTGSGRARVEELRASLPGRLAVRPYVPYEDRIGVPLARRILAWDLRHLRPTVVHARGLWAGLMAARLARRRPWLRVLYDARGDYVAERALYFDGRGETVDLRTRLGQWRIRRAEAEVCRAASRILCVSRALVEALEARYPGAAAKAHVVPSGFDPEKFGLDPALRREWRTRLGIGDRFVIAYSGSLIPWQMPEVIARAGAVACQLRPDVHLLMLTPEVTRMRALLGQAGVPAEQVTCLRAAHHEMSGYLNAADLALLLRRKHPSNRVCSPTKVAEYLACGLPVLLCSEIGDYSALVADERLGAVLDDPDDPLALREALKGLLTRPLPARDAVAAVARERLARDRFVPVYRELYGQLAGEALAAE